MSEWLSENVWKLWGNGNGNRRRAHLATHHPVNQIKWLRLVNSELAIKPQLGLGFVSKHVGAVMGLPVRSSVTSGAQLCTQLVKSEASKFAGY